MKRPRWKRCGHGPGDLTPEDQAAVDDFRALLPALKNPDIRAGDQPPASPAELPRQTDARLGTINCGEIGRKPRHSATALQKLHGI